jgi:CBS domain-containing protein
VLTLQQIMTADVATVAPETTLREATELLARRHVSGAPVVSDGRVVGVVTASDLLDFAAGSTGAPALGADATEWRDWTESTAEEEPDRENAPLASYFTDLWFETGVDTVERMRAAVSSDWDEMEEHSVEEVMTRHVWSLPPSATALEAAELMSRQSVHRVLVMERGRLLGVVTTTDIARAAAGHQLGTRTFVFNHDREFDPRDQG